MASFQQHKHLNGVVIPMILSKMGIEVTKETVLGLKELFKKYLGVASTARLTDREFSLFTKKVMMISAREWGIYIPEKYHEADNAEEMDLDDYLKMTDYY